MASNRHASFEDTRQGAQQLLGSHDPHDSPYGAYGTHPDATELPQPGVYFGPKADDDEPRTEWNPSEDTLRPVRGRHRVARKGGGTFARSRAVLGVGVIAAVGAGGMASADEGSGTVPGMDAAADKLRDIPGQLPVVGGLLSAEEAAPTAAPFTEAGVTEEDVEAGRTDAGEALRARILQQADHQTTSADTQTVDAALAAAEADAATEAAEAAEAERQALEEQREREEAERRRAEEEQRRRELAASYVLPLSDYRLSSSFGQDGAMWQSNHTGQDFAASTGTPVKNIHTGVVTEAAWAGSYGYRVIVQLEDGTEIWYCHLSSMSVSAGQEVVTTDQIGLVGSTGNSTGAHLHVEVRPGGGDAVDPLAWLRDKGLTV
ncbi:M23 family metallopeptidase [Streptomyces avicenniae]|uniref:M23 family metallopeptidase n=1 Tax=Streptomyces avicenniae TaxID=500153 RepID=UPI000ADA756E|nr:M23 family metallopeptidase [Streptomyces avicenniae]